MAQPLQRGEDVRDVLLRADRREGLRHADQQRLVAAEKLADIARGGDVARQPGDLGGGNLRADFEHGHAFPAPVRAQRRSEGAM
jgi:hypothetical protein